MVRVGFPGGPRLEWYDRNPIGRGNQYDAINIAPHAATVRWTYTVPTGKKAMLQLLMVLVERNTVATTPGLARAYIEMRACCVLCAELLTNNVGDQHSMMVGEVGTLAAGENVFGATIDQSTGGTMNYQATFLACEFDA